MARKADDRGRGESPEPEAEQAIHVIVAEFFDAGESRTLAWARRPQAAALVAQLADPDRWWDAIVIGEYERAFYGSQYASMAPLLEHYDVGLWTPEVGGRVDWHAEDHEQTMLALGLSSKREIARTRIRVRTAGVVSARVRCDHRGASIGAATGRVLTSAPARPGQGLGRRSAGACPGAGTGLPRPASAQAASFMTECRVCPVRRAWMPITICELP
jgi:hypothetical protein